MLELDELQFMPRDDVPVQEYGCFVPAGVTCLWVERTEVLEARHLITTKGMAIRKKACCAVRAACLRLVSSGRLGVSMTTEER